MPEDFINSGEIAIPRFTRAKFLKFLGLVGVGAITAAGGCTLPSRKIGRKLLESPETVTPIYTVDAKGIKISDRSHKVYYIEEVLDSDRQITLKMNKITGGTFFMGSSPEEASYLIQNFVGYTPFQERCEPGEMPKHNVTVDSFYIGRFPVTIAQWEAVMGVGEKDSPLNKLETKRSYLKGDDRPIVYVSWDDANNFCQKLSQRLGKPDAYRLPTEAEWEYACRAGTTTPFNFGHTITTDLANYYGKQSYISKTFEKEILSDFKQLDEIYNKNLKGQYRQTTTNVDEFYPNAFGLYDMHGNVWEWCQDQWHEYKKKKEDSDGRAWKRYDDDKYPHILRGGSWLSNPWQCRSAYRDRYMPNIGKANFGFRVVCS